MPFNKDQLKDYWQTHKEALNQKRREKRRLAKFGLATSQVSQVEPLEVSHNNQVEPKMANLTANPKEVSHGKPENGKPESKNVEPCPHCPELERQIKELEKPINPAIELWKKRYFDLEKEFHQKGNEQTETINRLKEKLREKDKEKQQLIEKYSKGENQANYKDNSLSMPNLYQLISKHKKIQSIQWKYSEKDI